MVAGAIPAPLGFVKKWLRYLAVGILTQGKARRASILDGDVSDEQRSHGSKAPGQMDAVIS